MSASTTTDRPSCYRPGCAGRADEDGYCDVCGFRWQPVPTQATASTVQPSGRERSKPSRIGPVPGDRLSTATTPTAPTAAAFGSGVFARSAGARGDLGAGLVIIEPVEPRDAAAVVLADPHLPAARRTCSGCGASVGSERDGRAALPDGFCTACGRRYSFTPKLQPGDLVGGQYLVAGCLAHGGMGWVYLAQDRKLHDRWVVLKGLLDSGDEPAMAAAIAERRFLSQVSHTNIVEIYNFVEHADAGYIVMEYVGGSSLREIRLARRADVGQPLPVSVVLAYGLEVLTALGFLHSRGLLYCDLKPDNVIHSGDLVKLIDLGGVRRIDDDTGDVFGTVGYQAPEISSVGPSVSSDLFTVGRLMAVLAVDFPGYQDEKRYATTLPPDGEAFARHPSFHHLLLRATDPDPGRRFRSAADMADQAFGVLRQVVAGEGGQVVPAASRRFGAERVPDADHATWRSLPLPLPDSDDDAAGVLATLAGATPEHVLEALEAVAPTREVRLRQVRAALESDDVTQARAHLAAAVDMSRQTPVPDGYGGDWRVQWWTAAVALATGGTEEAASALHAVSTWLPGELSPHLALGVLAETRAGFAEPSSADDEAGRHWQEAAAHYGLVSRTDPATSGASFASARALLKLGDRTGAITALDRVPPTAVAFGVAQIRICRALVAPVAGAPPAARELVRASEALGELDARDVSPTTQLALRREVLAAGLALTLAEPDGVDGIRLGGTPCREQDLRLELERTIRLLASHVSGDAERAALVDEANSWRPWTLT